MAAGESAPPRTVWASSSCRAASSRARRGLDGAPGGQVHHAADGDRDRHEQQQSQQVLGFGDGERVQRLGEVPVEQEAGGHGGEHGRPEAAEDRDRDHGDEVDEQVISQVQVRPPGREHRGEQRQRGGGEEHARDEPAAADRADHVGQARRPSRRLGGRRLGRRGSLRGPRWGPLGRAARSHARIHTHAYQCEPSGVPAEHQAETGSGQRAHADDNGRMGGGRPGRPQLRVGRPGESGRGEPADAGQRDRRDRLRRERHRRGDRRAGDQHPGGGQAAVQAGRHRAHGQEHSEAHRQRVGRRYRAQGRAFSHLPSYFSPATRQFQRS